MGAQFSGGLNGLKQNKTLERLAEVDSISENDPFWNQLLSFSLNLPFTKVNSQQLDEAAALYYQRFHQNNLKSGNYGTLIRVFCRLAGELRQMSDNQLLALQTTNALLLIRCFTKYLIEIENENALLEQLNSASSSSLSTSPPPEDGINTSSDQMVLKAMQNMTKLNIAVNSEAESDMEQPQQPSTAATGASTPITSDEAIAPIDILYQLVANIFELCIEVPVEVPHTYYLHLEALNTVLVLLSVQMYTKLPTHESYIYETFMLKMDRLVSDFVRLLLKNIVQQMPQPTPSTIQAFHSSALSPSAGLASGSILSSVASGLWSVMTLGLAGGATTNGSANHSNSSSQQIVTYLPHSASSSADLSASTLSASSSGVIAEIDCAQRLLAWQSCHILLVLSNHCTNESLYNPYRMALFHFTDTQDTPTNLPNSEPLPWLSIDYTKLFHMFTFTMHTDQYTLLLYMLLHRNQHFKMFILSRINIDSLIIPILKVIYTAPERNSHHIYMSLIILLILSEDDIFNKTIHTIPVKKLPWYTERAVSEISLGGLLVLVVIRTIQFNMTRMRDKYLHTNCLAALANMSSKFSNLHPYVCQRINSLFGLLIKKRAKIVHLLNSEVVEGETKLIEPQPQEPGQDLIQDLAIIEELMRMVLEIINSCLTNMIHHNSNLVYSILYNKSIYLQFRVHPTFQDVVQNIDMVITHFSNEIEHVEDKSIENLKEIIDLGVKQYSRERFKKFPELKFKYVEEDSPEDFFVPYVWSLTYKHSNLYWIDHSVKTSGGLVISADANNSVDDQTASINLSTTSANTSS